MFSKEESDILAEAVLRSRRSDTMLEDVHDTNDAVQDCARVDSAKNSSISMLSQRTRIKLGV